MGGCREDLIASSVACQTRNGISEECETAAESGLTRLAILQLRIAACELHSVLQAPLQAQEVLIFRRQICGSLSRAVEREEKIAVERRLWGSVVAQYSELQRL